MYGLGFEFGFSVSGSRVSVFLSWVTLDLRHILGHVGRGMELGHMSYRTSHARSATLYIFNRGSSSRRCFSPECRFGGRGVVLCAKGSASCFRFGSFDCWVVFRSSGALDFMGSAKAEHIVT